MTLKCQINGDNDTFHCLHFIFYDPINQRLCDVSNIMFHALCKFVSLYKFILYDPAYKINWIKTNSLVLILLVKYQQCLISSPTSRVSPDSCHVQDRQVRVGKSSVNAQSTHPSPLDQAKCYGPCGLCGGQMIYYYSNFDQNSLSGFDFRYQFTKN